MNSTNATNLYIKQLEIRGLKRWSNYLVARGLYNKDYECTCALCHDGKRFSPNQIGSHFQLKRDEKHIAVASEYMQAVKETFLEVLDKCSFVLVDYDIKKKRGSHSPWMLGRNYPAQVKRYIRAIEK